MNMKGKLNRFYLYRNTHHFTIPTQNIVTPLKNQIDEVKEEEVEESPDANAKFRNGFKREFNQDNGNEYSKSHRDQTESSPAEGSGSDQQQEDEEGEYEAEGEGDGQSEQIPLLFVDVNLGEGTTGKELNLNNILFR